MIKGLILKKKYFIFGATSVNLSKDFIISKIHSYGKFFQLMFTSKGDLSVKYITQVQSQIFFYT